MCDVCAIRHIYVCVLGPRSGYVYIYAFMSVYPWMSTYVLYPWIYAWDTYTHMEMVLKEDEAALQDQIWGCMCYVSTWVDIYMCELICATYDLRLMYSL